jgi:hypothetical protein
MKRGLAISIYIGFVKGQGEGEGQVDVIGVGWLVLVNCSELTREMKMR